MARGTKTVVYGIPNCDTVKKARVWLEEHNVEFEFHDFKKHGVTEPLVQDWLKDVKLSGFVDVGYVFNFARPDTRRQQRQVQRARPRVHADGLARPAVLRECPLEAGDGIARAREPPPHAGIEDLIRDGVPTVEEHQRSRRAARGVTHRTTRSSRVYNAVSTSSAAP